MVHADSQTLCAVGGARPWHSHHGTTNHDAGDIIPWVAGTTYRSYLPRNWEASLFRDVYISRPMGMNSEALSCVVSQTK